MTSRMPSRISDPADAARAARNGGAAVPGSGGSGNRGVSDGGADPVERPEREGRLQLPLVVAMVAQRFRLTLLPARPAEVMAAVTLRPRASC
jgi:hypothetical protein